MRKIEAKIISASELTRLLTDDDSQGITYSDLERMFSSEDLKEYDTLCETLVKLIDSKDNKEQWDMLSDPVSGSDLTSILNRILN